MNRLVPLATLLLALAPAGAAADPLPVVGDVEAQPLGANAERLAKALTFLGFPLPADTDKALQAAVDARDAKKIQEILDARALVQVSINPEARVKVARGPAEATLQQAGFVPFLIKVVNDSTVKKPLAISSPQAGPVYSGRGLSAKDPKYDPSAVKRFLHVELFTAPPMTPNLSGLKVEYFVGLVYSSEAGKREATLAFDIGQGTQDLGFRAEVPVLFEVKPGIPVNLSVSDFDGRPSVARFTFKDAAGHVYPPQAKRLRPDFFFQQQIYRADGATVLLPPGELTMTYGRGPEYKLVTKKVTIPSRGEGTLAVKLERWINPMDFGFYNGDHHIHAAGCAHYTSPTEGVFPEDMFLHVKGEGMNVGCCLTWGPCYDFQRQFFEAGPHKLSEPLTLLKYDVEVSGFGSQALGHVCLLNLRDQTYPGSDGTKLKGWPTWTTPLMRWAKEQGGVTGYAHSANGLTFDPPVQLNAASRGLLEGLDADKNGKIDSTEAAKGLLPEPFATADANGDGSLSADELTASIRRVKDRLPNHAIPPMNGIGAQEICVTSALKVCDFISAMDTQRVPEWNCWYHIMNCGFPLKASGETDFPCINGSRVGMGRVYVQLGKVGHIDFGQWCAGLARGHSYISDGYAHALEFKVNDKSPGDQVAVEQGGNVTVKAKVAFASEQPLGTADGGPVPTGKTRRVDLVVNGEAVASKDVPADDQTHDITFSVPIEKSSWVALRHFPSLHTNPVNVLVGGKPIRASRKSALWCIGTIEQLWRVRGPGIAPAERTEAEKTFQKAMEIYKQIAAESAEGS